MAARFAFFGKSSAARRALPSKNTTRSRTVATGIVVVCGLAVVVRLETEGGRRRLAVGGLCLLMALLFALALIIPFLRHFYELQTPTGDAIAAWAIGTTFGVGTMRAALWFLRL